jgi:hypothetical protein
MSTGGAAAIAVLVSLAGLVCLGLGDPKRSRHLQRIGAARAPARAARLRPVAAWGALLPGFVLALAGAWPAFLIWMGGTIIAGWLIAQALAPRHRQAGSPITKVRD